MHEIFVVVIVVPVFVITIRVAVVAIVDVFVNVEKAVVIGVAVVEIAVSRIYAVDVAEVDIAAIIDVEVVFTVPELSWPMPGRLW